MGNLDGCFSILVPDGEHHYLRTVANCLSSKKNIKIYVMSNQRNVPMCHSRFVHHFSYYPKTSDVGDWISNINWERAKYGIDLILPVFEDAMLNLLEHKHLLAEPDRLLILPSLENYRIAKDKKLFAKHLEKYQIAAPLTVQINNGVYPNGDFESIGFPLLAKPGVQSGGGIGIQRIQHQQDLDKFLKTVKNVSAYVFQEYIDGEDLGCNVLCKDGIILAYTLQKGFLWGSKAFAPQIGLEFIQEKKILDISKKLMKSLNWSGVANIDFIFDREEKSFKVLEVNPRYWATLDASNIAGVNFPYLHCLVTSGKLFDPPEYELIRYLSVEGIVVAARKNLGILLKPKHLWKNTPLRFAVEDPKAVCYHYFWAVKNRLTTRKSQ